ncbi:MAG: hypothetical protein Q7T96_11440 [Methylobacter sp.]|nr:hypothetical protein [Methylobacter sp.]
MKRNLFDELSEGFDALAEQRQGKRTLRTHEIEMKPAPELAAAELVALRERGCICLGRCSPVTCGPTYVLWRIGSKGEPNPTPKRRC